jgi:hypothetical protein
VNSRDLYYLIELLELTTKLLRTGNGKTVQLGLIRDKFAKNGPETALLGLDCLVVPSVRLNPQLLYNTASIVQSSTPDQASTSAFSTKSLHRIIFRTKCGTTQSINSPVYLFRSNIPNEPRGSDRPKHR